MRGSLDTKPVEPIQINNHQFEEVVKEINPLLLATEKISRNEF